MFSSATRSGWPILMLKKIEEGSARALISRFDVKKRVYFGNTSMEAEISLLMANQCLVTSSHPSFMPRN